MEASARLAGQLLQDFSHVNAAEESSLFSNQLQQYGFSFRTDRSQAPEIDDQLALFKICFGSFVRARELSGPRGDESALDDQSALAQAIEENRGKELIFIDTPGFAAGDLESAAPLAQFLSTRNDIDTQLVISSSMKSADLSRVVDRFAIFAPRRLLFTRLDET